MNTNDWKTTVPAKITLPHGTKRQLYVNKDRLRMNALAERMEARGELIPAPLPPLVCRNDSVTDGAILIFCNSVVIRGPSRFVYQPHAPLIEGRGPIAWLETEAEVELTL